MVPPRSHQRPTTILSLTTKYHSAMEENENKKSTWSTIFRVIEIIAAALAGLFGGQYLS